EHLVDQPERAAVRVVAEHDVPTHRHLPQHRVARREAARERHAVARPLQRRDARFERGARRVARARVLVALVLADGTLRERRRQRDGRDDRAGGGIRWLPDVDGPGLEPEVAVAVGGGVGDGHECAPSRYRRTSMRDSTTWGRPPASTTMAGAWLSSSTAS